MGEDGGAPLWRGERVKEEKEKRNLPSKTTNSVSDEKFKTGFL